MKTDNVVFSNENKQHYKCEIHELDDCYSLCWTRKNGLRVNAYFDKNERILSAVKDTILKFGNPRYEIHGAVFCNKVKRKTTHVCMLVQVVYAAIHGGKAENYMGRRIVYKDKNYYNLRGVNISYPENVKVSTVSVGENQYIRLRYKTGSRQAVCAITNYSPELMNVICSLHWVYDKTKLTFEAQNTYRKEKYPLYYLTWVFFKCGATEDNWKEKVAELRMDDSFSIDHKLSSPTGFHRWDNRIENLQAMTRVLNSQKGACTSKVKHDCFFIPKNDGAIYGKYNDGYIDFCHCPEITSENLKQIKIFCATGEIGNDTPHKQINMHSNEAVNLIMSDLYERKLYQEVCKL